MNRTSTTTNSSDRTPAITKNARPKTAAVRVGDATRRLLNVLMRSLAAPHV